MSVVHAQPVVCYRLTVRNKGIVLEALARGADPGPRQRPAPSPRRLYRSRDERMIAGVCGGLASYLGVDPTVVRLLTVASLLLPGPQILAYLLAWVLIPEEPV